MANLEKATSIYVDFKNLLFNTDKYVLEIIYKTMYDKPEFKALFYILEQTKGGVNDIKYFANQKKYKNPIIEIIQMSNAENTKGVDIEYMSDIYYNYILYELENENLDTELVPTNLANILRVLLKNESFETLFVYMEVPRSELCDAVYNFFTGSSKVFICTGNRADMFNEYIFDTYILEDIKDVESLYHLPTDIQKDIIVPNFPYNFNEDKSIRMDVQKGIASNMSVNSINLPL